MKAICVWCNKKPAKPDDFFCSQKCAAYYGQDAARGIYSDWCSICGQWLEAGENIDEHMETEHDEERSDYESG